MEEVKYKIGVVGSRDFTNQLAIFRVLTKNRNKISLIISGGAIGVDSIAEYWAQDNGFSILVHYPKWMNDDGSKNMAAGFERNTKIVNDCDILLAFRLNKSGGTTDSINKAIKLGKKVIVYDYETGKDEYELTKYNY